MLHEETVAILLIKILFSTSMTLLMIAAFTNFRYPKKWILLSFSVYMAYVFSTAWFLLESFSWVMFIRLIIFFIYLPAIILFYVLSEDRAGKLLFNCITQINLFIVIWLGSKLIGGMLEDAANGELFVSILLFSGVTVLQYSIVRKYSRKIFDELDCNWMLMTSVPIGFFILLWTAVLFPGEIKMTLWHVACIFSIVILMVAVYVVLFFSLVNNYLYLENHIKMNVMTAQLSAQEQNYSFSLEKQRKINRICKQVNEASELLWQGNWGRAADILMDITEANESGNARIYCANSRINEVVSYYAAECIEHNVRFTCDIKLDRRKLPVPEICLILNYGLENAFEAAVKLPMEQRFIKLQSRVVQGQLLTRIHNRFNGSLQHRGGVLHTEKQTAGHGYGLSSIQAAAIRARGEIMFRVEEDTFVLDVRVQAMPVENQ